MGRFAYLCWSPESIFLDLKVFALKYKALDLKVFAPKDSSECARVCVCVCVPVLRPAICVGLRCEGGFGSVAYALPPNPHLALV